MPDDLSHMQRAIILAMRGRGGVEPNPMVGCVIVAGDAPDRVIAEGYHARFGGPHAEADALSRCDATGATIYVTLEPCCHTNKKTPPCVPRIIAAKPRRVVIGAVDPNPDVAGRGVAELRSAGIAVEVLDLPAAKQLIAPFIAGIVHHRPYVTLKWAQTADGAVAGAGGRRLAISGPQANAAVHELRARCDAIVAGVSTVIADDPLLTVRGVAPMRPLLRVVLDPQLRTPIDSRLVRTAREHPTLVLTTQPADRAAVLREAGVEISTATASQTNRIDLSAALAELYRTRATTHVLVEAGPSLSRAMLEANLVDRLWIITAPNATNEPTAPKAPAAPDRWPSIETMLGRDRLVEYLNPNSSVYFSSSASADFCRLDSEKNN